MDKLANIKEKIKESEIISFDIFETCVIRTVKYPKQVFDLVLNQSKIKINDFPKSRVKAEATLRTQAPNEEITLDEIYNAISFENQNIRNEYKILEEKIEEFICVPNPDIKNVYDYALSQNKKIIFTSDMYLSLSVIKSILQKCGYAEYNNIYLSSELNLKKSSGSMFKYIVSKERTKSILHIGNDFKSDYLMPKINKLQSYKYNYSKNPVRQSSNLQEALILAFTQKNLKSEKGFYYKFGYQVLGPAIFGYVNWIREQITYQKIKKIFFFAREGKFIKRAFDKIENTQQLEEKYVCVSRRSLTIPALASVKKIEDFLAFRPIRSNVKIKDELEKLSLIENDIKGTTWYNPHLLNKTFGQIDTKLKAKIIKDLFFKAKTKSKLELTTALDYLKQEEMCGRFALVDIGWNGSMQRALNQILESNDVKAESIGFFMAQRDEYYKNAKYITNYGYLFNYGKVSNKENLLLNSGTNFLELLFSADHGSTIKYQKVDGKVKPIFDEYEYTNIWPMILEIQNAAIDFIDDFQSGSDIYKPTCWHDYFLPFYSVLENPSKKILNEFGDWYISDMNEKGMRLAPKLKLKEYFSFIKHFKNSTWKVAFLKRNLFTDKSFEIYCFLRKYFNK